MTSYLFIKVEGRNISKFLTRCHSNNIDILNTNIISHKEMIIKIRNTEYDRLLEIKSIYKLTIISSSGFIKFKELLNKNKHFIIISIIGLLFLIYLCNTIFTVTIISSNSSLSKKIKKDLEEYGIKKYSLKKSYNKVSKIKENLLEKYNDQIEWMEITDIGTKYEIKIVERKKPSKEEEKEYTNIIASKSGVIKRIYAEDGMKVVEENTYVNKGEIIISGAIMKDEEVKSFVTAKGKVYAEVWYNVNIEFPLKYTEKQYTNNKKKTLYIKLADKYISRQKYENFDRKSIVSLKNRLIPFEIGIETQREVKIINDKYTIEEAKSKAILKAKEQILQTLDKDEYISSQKTLNFYAKDSKIVLDIFFSCYEEIGAEEKIIPE